jgi:CRISPR-associated protein Cmr6
MSQDQKRPKRLTSFQELANLGGKKDLKSKDIRRPGPGPYDPNRESRGPMRTDPRIGRGGGSPDRGHRGSFSGDGGRQGSIPQEFFPMPSDVAEDLNWKSCQNFSLLFNRFIPHSSPEDWSVDKPGTWNEIEKIANSLSERQKRDIEHLLRRQLDLRESLKNLYGDQNVIELPGKTLWRLAIGLGNANPLEAGMTLHRLYGIPYLPGTAIKGICRAWKLSQINPLECKQQEYKFFLQVFGDQDGKGMVQIYDAYPVKGNSKGYFFDLDIINVHYQPYYQNPKNAPADYSSPVPNYFLTIPEGVEFHFLLSLKRREDHRLLQEAAKWLKEALRDFGIGAKTSVGYGEIRITGGIP